jgi:hypothetical protein
MFGMLGNCWLLLKCLFPLFMQAYDQHLNMILGDVEEVVTTVEIDDETYEEIVRVSSFAFLPLVCINVQYVN